MAYDSFTFKQIKKQFNIDNKTVDLFQNQSIPPVPIPPAITEALEVAYKLPVRSEKAKSELIVMPILVELMKQNDYFFTIYSGDTLEADKNQGLNGECDFILAKNTGHFAINTPIFTLLEAKRHDIIGGLEQCAAQMIGAKWYNKEQGKAIDTIYGCVTTADEWLFLCLKDQDLLIDRKKYYLVQLEELLGILQFIINQYK